MELKKVDWLLIIQVLSTLLRMYGAALAIPTVVALLLGDISQAISYFFTGIIIFAGTSGVLFLLEDILEFHEVRLKHAIICLALAWILVSLISTIPFLQSGMSFINSFFESFSGWTGTGLSMIPDPSKVPASLNFFRGFIQWVGGFGIIILALLVYAKPTTAKRLFSAEGRSENFLLDFKKIARIVVAIFSFYTFLGIIALTISGVPFFDAIVHTMSTISTGGFSSNSVGIGLYGVWPMLIAIILMIIGSTSFNNHYDILRGNYKKFFKNPEVIFMFFLIFVSAIIIFGEIWFMKAKFFYDAFFYIFSAMSGTGAGTPLAMSTFNSVSIIVLIFLMISGTCYGSTSGAVKLWRILIVGKIIRREIVRNFLPEHAIIPIKIGDQNISDDQALKVTAYTLLYISVLFIGSMIFMLSGYKALHSIFIVASAQGNVGLNILPDAVYYGMNPLLKLLLAFHMLLGRIEIFPFLILLRSVMPGNK
ncbi:TrkH family potassium uptake protein [Candidatus Woesearchaeota archaeon]|nr:TrkH family potassium uptake protein [Candidatus Woesearchaeota archaeon]